MKYLICFILIVGCAKNNPEKSILGQWEVICVDSKEIINNNSHIWEDFKNDLYYFQNITFYKDSIFHIEYINGAPKQGSYYIEKINPSLDIDGVYTKHFPLQNDSTLPHKFNFFQARYDIKEFKKNKLVVTTDWLAGNDTFYKSLTLTLKKTGDFE